MGTLVIVGLLLVAYLTLRALGWYLHRRESPVYETTTYRCALVLPRGAKPGTMRLALAMILVGQLVNAALYVFDVIATDAAIAGALTFIALPAAFVLGALWGTEGVVEVSPDQLVVDARRTLHVYRWRHVASAFLQTWKGAPAHERLWYWLLGIDMSEPFVELRLRKSQRVGGIWRTEFGTDVAGIPNLVKTVRVFVDDPDGLVRAAKPYLAPGDPA